MFNFKSLKKNKGFILTLTLLSFCSVSLKKFYLNKVITIFGFKRQNSSKTRARAKLVCGFTLVEMIVVVAIVIVMTSVLLLKQSKFSSDILVTNAAYEVALAIREAQVYGISSKQTTSNTNVAYGVNFNNSSSNAFTIYSDSGDGGNPIKYPFNYNGGAAICGSSEYCPIDNPMLTQGQTIKKICVDSDCSITSLNIGFIKPNPEAVIHDSTSYTLNRGSAIIVIASALGDKCRVVRVTSIGQISVDAPVSSGSDCDQTK